MEGFNPAEEEMFHAAVAALQTENYDASLMQVLIRADMPLGYRGMSLDDGAALSEAAFSSQAMLNHVMEEELLHLQQKVTDQGQIFATGTARKLEGQLNERRRFPLPKD